jgi:hypothetical protein
MSISSAVNRAKVGVREMFFTSADLAKPDRLYQVIHQIQQNLALALRIIGDNPMITGRNLTGIAATAGQQQNIKHGLGRPYVGWFATGAHATTASFVEILPGDPGYPPGLNKGNALVLLSANTGVYNLFVF